MSGRKDVGFFNPAGSENEWQVRMHATLAIPVGMLGLKEIDKSCHHGVWCHLLHVNVVLVVIVYHGTTNLADRIRERGTHVTTTARKGDKTVRT